MHEGEWSSRLGLPGQPSEAEELMVMRDIALARLTGGRIHFQHLSTAGSVGDGRGGEGGRHGRSPPRRRRTTSRSPTRAAPSYDATFKVHPPLRADGDRRRGPGRASRRDDRRDRHRPRPAPRRREGASLRRGASRACWASSTPWPWRSPSSASTWPTCWRVCRGARRAIAGVGEPPRRPARRGSRRRTCA